jgi:spore germination protein
MKPFEYGDGEIGEKDVLILLSSHVIAIAVLTLPRTLAKTTNFIDGWISLLIAGVAIILLTGITVKLASRFPNQTFFTYASAICSKPVAAVLTVLFVIHFIVTAAYETRYITIIAKQYLLDRTPAEIIALVFLLIVVYAVAGSRVGIIRLNLLFFPIILFVALLVILLNIPNFDAKHLTPFFTTSWKGYWQGAKESFISLSGFEIFFFYTALVNRPKKVTKYAMMGASIPIGLYLIVYIVSVGVFTADTTATLVYPTVELAKEAEVPGGFFGRLESLFFTIWIMAIFNTASIAFDVALLAIGSLFKRIKKITFIFIFTPIIYLIAMLPQNFNEVQVFQKFIIFSGTILIILLPIVLLLLAKVRGIKGNG